MPSMYFILWSPESNRCKLVENGRVNILIISRLSVGKISKSPPSEDNGKKLSVGDLLKFSSNQLASKLKEVFSLCIQCQEGGRAIFYQAQ